MTTINDKFNINIRTGLIADIPRLVELNHSWYKPNLTTFDEGFLSVTYDTEVFLQIISNSDLLVFENVEKAIKGYVLVNTVMETNHIKDLRSQYFSIFPTNKQKRLAFSCQLLLEQELHGTGFIDIVQSIYSDYFKSRYDILVSTINNGNHRSIKAHIKTGWKLYDTAHNYKIAELSLCH